jgi:hypothetical protein
MLLSITFALKKYALVHCVFYQLKIRAVQCEGTCQTLELDSED